MVETGGEELAAANEELLAKIEELESKFPKIEMMITNLRKENETLRESIDKINENFQDIMALYEVVSNQINPFIGISKITATSMEKLEKLEYETKILRKKIDELQKDVVILADIYLRQYDIDINDIIEDILAEEEISKIISREEDIHD
ncbi:flagella accessory protein C [Methanofervidicoccus abyssi]|uniref:Archaeal flagellar protein FlaC n=1 Tax=Methanofervidicoccus abyssi TaxID=2082189 RepID=A0A401HPC8_9EURY|nr:flagella accessory protein C [Methanofervidicoccus abyssi]GBF36089.1 archaeal flagellar protein FlaC [Methanofervidicoccus abyssi]